MRGHAIWAGLPSQVPPSSDAFPLPVEGGTGRPRETWVSLAPLNPAAGMARLRSVVLRPWIRELVLGLERLSSPRAGQLLQVSPPTPQGPEPRVGPRGGGIDVRCCGQVLQEAEAEAPGPSCAPDTSDVGAALLVSDGTHCVRCLLTRETLDASDW